MTRSHRAIQLSSACLLTSLVALSPLMASPANAGVSGFPAGIVQPHDSAQAPDVDSEATSDAALGEIEAPAYHAETVAASVPTVEKGGHRVSCVPYARERSGLQIFGDAKYWWKRAGDLYARVTQPVADAVMVFSGSRRIRHGHVAVVTAVIGPREIKIDHANWQNHGEIDLNMPVMDVSKKNDWSEVRVWDPRTGQFGARVYAISGFIMRTPPVTRGS